MRQPLWLGAACLLWACASPPAGAEAENFRQALESRYLQGDTLTAAASALLARIPAELPGWEGVQEQGAAFTAGQPGFATASRTYRDPEGYVLKIGLADYGADSAALLRVYRSLRQETGGGLPARYLPDGRSGGGGLEALEQGRYLWSLRSDRPDAAQAFDSLRSALPALRAMGRLSDN
jgi:hypothetical protein